MFTLYGNQYESREEHLLLTMFQVGGRRARQDFTRVRVCLTSEWIPRLNRNISPSDPPVCPIGSIRNSHRLRVVAPSKHPSLAHDDNLHAARARSILPQIRSRRPDQQSDRAQGPQPRDQPAESVRADGYPNRGRDGLVTGRTPSQRSPRSSCRQRRRTKDHRTSPLHADGDRQIFPSHNHRKHRERPVRD